MAVPRSGGQVLVEWFNPDPRAVMPLDRFHVPSSLRQRVRSGRFRITCDRAFDRVIRACARTRPGSGDGSESWIDGRIIAAYGDLHASGHAHSLEAWLDRPGGQPALVGGLYGVHIGGLFAGESMFSRPDLGGTDASKVCLVHLVSHLRRRGFSLLDAQFSSPHLERFGCVEIPRRRYLSLLEAAVRSPVRWEPFEPAHG